MRTIVLAATVALGVAANVAQAPQGIPSSTQQAPVGVPSTIPRIPTTSPALPPPASPGATTAEVAHPDRVLEQERIIQQIQNLPEAERERLRGELERRGIDLGEAERSIREGKVLPRKDDVTIFRVIKDELKPIPIGPGGLEPAFPATAHPWGRALDAAEALRMLTAAQSVGRIEMGKPAVLQGTAFVIAPGLVATNCHVLHQIAQPAGNNWILKGPVQIDFSEGSAHLSDREYTIEAIGGYPIVPFLDVALLRVAETSLGGKRLPPPLRIRRTPLAGDPPRGLLVGVVGYPNLLNVERVDPLTQATYRRIRESGQRAKTLSLGAVVGVESHQGIDFVDHVASTHVGQSGSPVIDRASGDVIGVHYCCAFRDAPPVSSALPCSSQLLSDRENNEAVSTWTAAKDTVIGPLFPVDRAARPVPALRLPSTGLSGWRTSATSSPGSPRR